jgi:hypothetical protein
LSQIRANRVFHEAFNTEREMFVIVVIAIDVPHLLPISSRIYYGTAKFSPTSEVGLFKSKQSMLVKQVPAGWNAPNAKLA